MFQVLISGTEQEKEKLQIELSELISSISFVKNINILKENSKNQPVHIVISPENENLDIELIKELENGFQPTIIATNSDMVTKLPLEKTTFLICGFEEISDVHIVSNLDGAYEFSTQRNIKTLLGTLLEPFEISIYADDKYSLNTICLLIGILILTENTNEKITCNII